MKKRIVIKRSNQQTQLPLMKIAVAFLLLKHFNAPQWLWGAAGLFYIIVTIAAIWLITIEKRIDLFEYFNKKN